MGSITRSLSRWWLLGVISIVVVLAGAGIWAIRSSFETGSFFSAAASDADVVMFNPKFINYELYGTLGGHGKVNYLGADSTPHQLDITTLPWSHTEQTVLTAVSPAIVAQVDGGSLGCRITVNDDVRDAKLTVHEHAAVSCTVQSA